MNKLLALCYPLLNLAMQFKQQDTSSAIGPDSVNKILSALTELEHELKSLMLAEKSIDDIKYALVAFIDEAIVNSACPWREEWMLQPLQMRYFNEHLAGENFFVRLNALCNALRDNIDIIEIYYLCLLLGFEGKYRIHEYAQLRILMSNLASNIQSTHGDTALNLCVQNARVRHFHQEKARVRWWMIIMGMLFVATTIYFSYFLAINHQAAIVLQSIENSSK